VLILVGNEQNLFTSDVLRVPITRSLGHDWDNPDPGITWDLESHSWYRGALSCDVVTAGSGILDDVSVRVKLCQLYIARYLRGEA